VTGANAAVPNAPAAPGFAPLSLLETRVIGVLVEKEKTVPDTYPLSLNGLVSGCNQKNNRDPFMNANDAQVQAAVDALKARSIVIESSGARVARYSHNLGRVLQVPDQAVILLAALMLRGAQTSGELRIGTERLHRFADISAVEGFLDEMAARTQPPLGALVVRLPRRPGEREQRWAHLLSGPVAVASAPELAEDAGADLSLSELAAIRAHQAQLAGDVAELRSKLERLARELGVDL
jgi:uncharacterized protein